VIDARLSFGIGLSIAAVLAPLLSIVIFAGVPFHSIALPKHRAAALRTRLAVSRKSAHRAGAASPDGKPPEKSWVRRSRIASASAPTR
jgi:hypothetical protein